VDRKHLSQDTFGHFIFRLAPSSVTNVERKMIKTVLLAASVSIATPALAQYRCNDPPCSWEELRAHLDEQEWRQHVEQRLREQRDRLDELDRRILNIEAERALERRTREIRGR
jgi:hypothetical protein